ncbi:MAG: 50S ribosomal protein L9 [Bacteroidetes bacterium RIFCSPLOWO2_12_FULL_35_15]|nr:MAG: 50S ribosomal protein L9 [Bacteroidetes bacterium RIFCSPLOWO2_12_FULL_35_15]
MEVILKQDVKNLGYKDDVVNVKPGYGRNFLIPKGVAAMATGSAKKMLTETVKQRAFKEQKIKTAAESAAAKLKEMIVKVGAKVGESGKIFGSVTTVQLADAIKKLGYDVDRKNITMTEESIKTVGTYTADVRFHKEVTGTVTFEVVQE